MSTRSKGKSGKFRTLTQRLIDNRFSPYSRKSVSIREKKPSLSMVEEDISSFVPQERSIIFTIARMNPPTSGHIHLIRFLVAKAIELNQQTIYILLQAGEKAGGEQQNPLYCHEKKLYLTEMITNSQKNLQLDSRIKIVIICADEAFLYNGEPTCNKTSSAILNQICYMCTLENIQTNEPVQLHLFIGEDRLGDFKKFLGTGEPGAKSYLPPSQKISYHKIDRPLDESGKPIGISATKVRAMAQFENPSAFITEEMSTGLTLDQAADLYTLLHERMKLLPLKYSVKTSKKGGRKQYKRKTRRNKNKKLFKKRN